MVGDAVVTAGGADCEYVVAVDIGGTKIAVGLVDSDLRVRGQRSAPTPAQEGSEAIIAAVARLVYEVLEDNADGHAAGVMPIAVGIGTAGTVDVRAGRITASTETLRGWAGTELAASLARTLALEGLPPVGSLPVFVLNDVDAHARGEAELGAAAGHPSALVVAVGTGIGAGVLLEGPAGLTPLIGARHSGGDLAHLPVPGAEHLRCTCGRMGHLEAIGSGLGLHQHYLSLGGDAAVTDSREISARAAAGDPLALRAITDSAAVIGRGIAGAVAMLDPAVVVVSGSVPAIGEAWWAPMEAALRAELTDGHHDLPVVLGTLGGDAPLAGAAAHAFASLRGAH